MIKWIKYRLAAARAVDFSEATEAQNKARIIAEEQEFRDFYEDQLRNGTQVDSDAGVFGRRSRRDRAVIHLNSVMVKAKRDVAEIHTAYLLREVDRLGIPRPELDTPELWLSRREEYFLADGSRGDADARELLSSSGLQYVRAAIRKERRERFEPWKDRAGLIFGAAGLIIAVLTITLRIIEVAVSRPIPTPSSEAANALPPAMPAPSLPSTAVPPLQALPAPSPSPPAVTLQPDLKPR
jgi:hypothetical protein